jgi:hypothetical protein
LAARDPVCVYGKAICGSVPRALILSAFVAETRLQQGGSPKMASCRVVRYGRLGVKRSVHELGFAQDDSFWPPGFQDGGS